MTTAAHPARSAATFADRLAVVPDFVAADRLAALSAAVEALGRTERSFVPTHKKGGTIAYDTLRARAPEVVAFYQSAALIDRLSQIVGERLQVTPERDNSSCSILVYEQPGDHIGWHFDHNFYRGRHFTVLLPLINRNAAATDLAAARLYARVGGDDRMIPTPPNQLVMFEGAKVLHKATPIAPGERRVLLSMTFGTDPRNSWPKEVARRIKDTAFFGLRALWGGKTTPVAPPFGGKSTT